MVWHGSTYIVPQDRSFRGTLYFFGQVDSVPWGLAVPQLSGFWKRDIFLHFWKPLIFINSVSAGQDHSCVLDTARPRGTLSTWPEKYSVPRNDLS